MQRMELFEQAGTMTAKLDRKNTPGIFRPHAERCRRVGRCGRREL